MNILTHKGRIGRLGFIAFTVLILVGVFKILNSTMQYDILGWGVFFTFVFGNYLIIILIIKRLHDLNLPGKAYWTLTFLSSGTLTDFMRLVAQLFFGAGTDGPNDYGDKPLL